MSDIDGQIFRLTYKSQSTIDPGDRREQLGAIFTAARRNNRGEDITGALLVTDDSFVQTLEGAEPAVRALYEQISGDPRHRDVTLLDAGEVGDRVFGRWAMAKVAQDDGPDLRLVANANRRTIVATSPDHHITPEQESVLAFMRGAVAHESADG